MPTVRSILILAALAAVLPAQASAQGFMNIDGSSYAYYETSALIDRIGCTSHAPRTCNTSPSLVGDRIAFVGLEFKAVRTGIPLRGFGAGFSLIGDVNAISSIYDQVVAGDRYMVVASAGEKADDYYASTDDFRCSEGDDALICHVLYFGTVQDGDAGQYVALDGFYVFDSKNLFWTLVDGLSGVVTIVDILN